MPEKVAKRISEAFKGVASFSTRDQNTHDFVASLTDADIEDNLDPVLIYNFDDELEDVEMPRVPEHYCVIYSYYNRIHTRRRNKRDYSVLQKTLFDTCGGWCTTVLD